MKLRIFLHCSFDRLSHRFSFPRPWLRLRSATEVENYFIVCCFVLFFETQRLFIIPMFLRKQSWRNSLLWSFVEIVYFLSQSSRRYSEMMAFLMALRNIGKSWSCELWSREVEIFCFLKRFFTMLRFVQNDTVLFFTHD